MESGIEDAISSIGCAIQIALRQLKLERDATGDDVVEPRALKLELCKKIDALRSIRTTLEDLALM